MTPEQIAAFLEPRPNDIHLANPYSQGGCFFCGKANPIGPRLEFYRVQGKEKLVSRWLPDKRYLGLGRVLHGGIQAGLMDEIMGWTAHHFSESPGVTTGISVEYLGPLYMGSPVEIFCEVSGREPRRIHLEAGIKNAEGKLCARGRGSYAVMSEERFNKLVSG